VRKLFVQVAVIPIVLSLLGLHVRKRRRSPNPLSSTGQTTNQTATRTRIVQARVEGPPRKEDIPSGDRSHGPREKRERKAETNPRPNEGPVWFNPPKKSSKISTEQLRQAEEYVGAANDAYYNGQLSQSGRISVSKDADLNYDKESAAADERDNPSDGLGPYGDKVAAHLPDTTWTDDADPPGGWGRHDDSINSAFGSQSGLYPEGWQPKPGPVGVQPFNLHPDWYTRHDPTL
jgi:hypothetical protein